MKSKTQEIHKAFLIGIKGVGMASLAYILDDLGIEVKGSDVADTFVTSYLLHQRGFKIYPSFDPKIISQEKPDLVITTGAHGGKRNPQFLAALQAKIPAVTHAQALGWLMNQKKFPISVAGVGGKTTISALLSQLLTDNHYEPSYAVGAGSLKPLIWPGAWRKGKYFIAEADEYATCPLTDHRPRFYWQKPQILILTNIEYDHPDIYQNLKQTLETFLKFSQQTLERGGQVISFFDNPNNQWIINQLRQEGHQQIISYGFSEKADWQIEPLNITHPQTKARLVSHFGDLILLKLKLPGKFNLANAAAATIAAHLIGLNPKQITTSLSKFIAVQRRFEFLGQLQLPQKEVKLYDDYAHHPQEIKTTLQAARIWFPHQQIGVIFQPHTFSRTRKLFDQFVDSLLLADKVYLAPVFASAREKKSKVNWQKIMGERINRKMSPHQKLHLVSQPEEFLTLLKKEGDLPDVLFTMGAGNIYKWGQKLLSLSKTK